MVGAAFWEKEGGELSDVWAEYYRCLLCGWSWRQRSYKDLTPRTKVYQLKEFEISSLNVSLAEVGTYIKNKFADPSSLSWERFEDLTNDVLKQHGFQTIQTARTHDEGADILLIGSSDKVEGIIECKKYAANRPIGVSIIRELVGSSILWETKKAYLVTSSVFTSFSKKAVKKFSARGYELNLVDATEFLNYLSIYNEHLPDLASLTEQKRLEIINGNKEIYNDIPVKEFVSTF
ncbi:MAG: restriction endonuclease [Methylococcaceae bacterium]